MFEQPTPHRSFEMVNVNPVYNSKEKKLSKSNEIK